MTELREHLSDVVAIPVTPFVDGEVDATIYASLLERMLGAGIRVLTPNGNTGEFYALRPEERRLALEITGATATGAATIVAGIGLDTHTAIAEGRIAAENGATAVMIHQPVHPYISRAGWISYHRTIADQLPDLGVVLYVKNSWVDGAMIRELVDASPNVVGVKYAVADPVCFARIREESGPGITWIAGLAEPYAVSYFAHGATGFTSGLVSVNPALSLDLLEALRAGDYGRARALTQRIARFEDLRAADQSANNVSVIKEALRQLGLAPSEVRAPSSALSEQTIEEVGVILEDWGTDYDLLAPTRTPAGVVA